MKALKIISLVIFSLLLVIIGWSYLLGMGLERTVFNFSYYEGLIEHEDIEMDDIISGIVEEIDIDLEEEPGEILNEEREEEMFPGMSGLLQKIMADALEETIEASWVEEQALLVVEDMLRLARGDVDTLSVVIELDDFQEKFMENMEQRIKAVTDEELIEAGVPEENLDQVKGMFIEEFTQMMEEAAEENGEGPEIPLEIDLGQVMQEGELSPEFELALNRVQAYHTYFPALHYAAFAVILLLSCLLAGIWGGLKWFGTSAMVSSVTFLGGLFVAQGLLIIPMLTETSEELPLALDILTAAAGYTVSRMYLAPIVFAGIGLVFLIVGLIFGNRAKK